jgi:hypothetical protein
MSDDLYNDQRGSERVAANFSVAFREIGDAEAALWSAASGEEPTFSGFREPERRREGGAALTGQTVNLGQGGLSVTGDLQLLGDHRLERGKKFLVEFSLPGGYEPVRCAAVVAWALEGTGGRGKVTAGLMFLGMRPSDLEKIAKYVEHKR